MAEHPLLNRFSEAYEAELARWQVHHIRGRQVSLAVRLEEVPEFIGTAGEPVEVATKINEEWVDTEFADRWVRRQALDRVLKELGVGQ